MAFKRDSPVEQEQATWVVAAGKRLQWRQSANDNGDQISLVSLRQESWRMSGWKTGLRRGKQTTAAALVEAVGSRERSRRRTRKRIIGSASLEEKSIIKTTRDSDYE